MASANLLTLLDDIATLLDDVAILTKVAAKKTAGVLGDDLALNAEQVSGVKADRELPVVWAVAKGSLVNKVILVPAALIISAFIPFMIPILLVCGGLYLCFEGSEKVIHKVFHNTHDDSVDDKQKHLQALMDDNVDIVSLEKQKIKGAIRTDFILSAEIIVIVLGTVQASSFITQVSVLTTVAFLITVGVYGLVACIVKLDDVGLYLLRKSLTGSFDKTQRFFGRLLLRIAPLLMRSLAILGTIAMFLVGGGILVHNIPTLHHLIETVNIQVPFFSTLIGSFLIEGFVGLLAGLIILLLVSVGKKIIK